MKIELDCSECATRLRVPAEHAGKMARCPSCSHLNLIPGGMAPAPASAAAEPRAQAAVADPNYAEPKPDSMPVSQGGNPYAASSVASMAGHLKPHRGTLVLILGIVSIFANIMFVPGIAAWIMGRADLRDMKSGLMDRDGESNTRVGMIIGMVMTILGIIAIVFMFGMVILFAGFAAANG